MFLKKGAKFELAPKTKNTMRALLAKLPAELVLAYPDRAAADDGSRSFSLCCEVCIGGFGAALEQEQADSIVRPIVYISRAALLTKRN